MHVRSFLTAAALTAVALPSPASAESAWVVINEGTAPGAAGVTAHLHRPLPVLAAKPGTCVPKHRSVEPKTLTHQTWLNTQTREVAFQWFNGGKAEVSADCATGVRLSVQLSDYAPKGEPPVLRGAVAQQTSTSATGSQYVVNSSDRFATLWVTYYAVRSDTPGVYERGPSLVETRVKGEYRDQAGKWVVYGCYVTYNAVQPSPTGPVVSAATQPEPCPA